MSAPDAGASGRQRGNGRGAAADGCVSDRESLLVAAVMRGTIPPDAVDHRLLRGPGHALLVARVRDRAARGEAVDPLSIVENLASGERALCEPALIAAIRAEEACSGAVELELSARAALREVGTAAAIEARRRAGERLLTDPDADLGRVREMLDHAEALEEGRDQADPIGSALLSGAALDAAADATATEVRPAIGAPGHIAILAAPSGVGKTAATLVAAMATACGAPRWPGDPAPEAPGRVLMISPDEHPGALMRRARGLSMMRAEDTRWAYRDSLPRLDVLGYHRDAPADLAEALRGERLVETIDRLLGGAERRGDPCSLVTIDAWADVLPIGASENDNSVAAWLAGALARLAARFDLALLILHHERRGADLIEGRDPFQAGRGAGALAAKCRVATVLERVPSSPNLRRMRTATNLGPAPAPITFEVCPPDADPDRREVLYWRPTSELAQYDPEELLGDGPLSTTALAWRIVDRDPEPGRSPPGEALSLARRLRRAWESDGRAVTTPGPRGSKMIGLARPSEPS